jgi:hypothetical protein
MLQHSSNRGTLQVTLGSRTPEIDFPPAANEPSHSRDAGPFHLARQSHNFIYEVFPCRNLSR